jgi:cell division septation protein DedD
VNKVRLGIYPTKEEALKNMRELNKKAGYKDAFVVEEHSTDASLVVGPPNAAASNKQLAPATYSNTASAKGLATKGVVPAVLYSVQLGSFNTTKAINVMEYASVAPMGNVYTKSENGMNKIRLGVWPNHANAEAAQEEAVALGFKDAIVVTEKGSDESVYGFLLSSVGSKNLPSAQFVPEEANSRPITYSNTSTKKGVTSYPYYIKIAALANPERFDAKPLADIGGYIEKRKGDKGMTNILLGGFSDIESATLAQNKVIIKGYEGTYVVKEEKGKLIRQ